MPLSSFLSLDKRERDRQTETETDTETEREENNNNKQTDHVPETPPYFTSSGQSSSFLWSFSPLPKIPSQNSNSSFAYMFSLTTLSDKTVQPSSLLNGQGVGKERRSMESARQGERNISVSKTNVLHERASVHRQPVDGWQSRASLFTRHEISPESNSVHTPEKSFRL